MSPRIKVIFRYLTPASKWKSVIQLMTADEVALLGDGAAIRLTNPGHAATQGLTGKLLSIRGGRTIDLNGYNDGAGQVKRIIFDATLLDDPGEFGIE